MCDFAIFFFENKFIYHILFYHFIIFASEIDRGEWLI